MSEPTLRILSLGAGVQSTTLALMAAHGLLGALPDCAIFSDTQWEPKKIYRHLEWLKHQLPFPVHAVNNGNLREAITDKATGLKGRFAAIPFFTADGGMGRRQCTNEYKLVPLTRKQRELLGVPKGRRVAKGTKVEVWIGISTDEAHRMKPSEHKWQNNRWPLIEEGMSRLDCLNWMERNGYPRPPKSRCIGCPFHSDAMWVDMRDNDPESWADAVEVDRLIRSGGTLRGMKAKQYMHRSLVPLDEVVFSQDYQPNLFGNECLGMCGV